jgi:hypothetical protein
VRLISRFKKDAMILAQLSNPPEAPITFSAARQLAAAAIPVSDPAAKPDHRFLFKNSNKVVIFK